MVLIGDSRSSDSPLVNMVWTARSEGSGAFTSVATGHSEMVVTHKSGKIATMTIRGPETRPTPASYGPEQEWFGIQFNIGVAFPQLAAASLVNQAITLLNAADRRFWLHGSSWSIPDNENADQFVQRHVDDGILLLDPVAETLAWHHSGAGCTCLTYSLIVGFVQD